MADWALTYLNNLAAATGASVEQSDVNRLHEYEAGIAAGTTTQAQLDAHMEALRQQYIMRGAPTGHRAQDSQSGLYAGSDPQTEPGYVETRDTTLFKVATTRPPATASSITTLGASQPAQQTPTVGPVGLAYPDDPVNYATMDTSPAAGYTGGLTSGIYPVSGPLPGPMPATGGGGAFGLSTPMVLALLAAAGVAIYFVMKK